MSNTIVYIHGVGGVTPLEDWLDPLNVGLAQAGHSPVDPSYDRVIPVTYQSLLVRPTGKVTRADEPKDTWEHADDDQEAARRYALVQEEYASLVRTWNHRARGVHFGHTPIRMSGQISNVVTRVGDLGEAKVYASSRTVRADVVRDVLSQLPTSGEVLLLAHSLGSVIAADLLTKLPPQLKVRALVTLGSPLASEMWKHARPLAQDFPYDRVDAWINVFDPRDPITFGRGIATRFPMAVDLAVDIRSHSVSGYASHPAVGALLGRLLYGEAAAAGSMPPARPLTPGWQLHLLGFAYAEQLSRTCQPKKFAWRKRFDAARRIAAARVVEEVEQSTSVDLGSPPTAGDFLDRASDLVRDVWSDDELVPLAVSRYAGTPLPPFDLSVDPQHRVEALAALFDRVRRRQGSISDTEFARAVASAVEASADALSTDRRRWRGPLGGGGGSSLVTRTGGPGLWAHLPSALADDETAALAGAGVGSGSTVGAMLSLMLASGVGTLPVATDPEAGSAVDLTVAVADALALVELDELRALLTCMLAVVRTQEALGLPSTREHVGQVLLDLQSRLAQEAHLHALVAPKRPGTRALADRADLAARAVDVLLEPATAETDEASVQ